MTGSIEHFIKSNGDQLVKAADAIANSDFGAFGSVSSAVCNLSITKSIANSVSSSRASMAAFLDEIPAEQLKLLTGLVATGVGGGILSEVAFIAAGLAVSTALVQFVGIALIIIGVIIVLPVLWKAIKSKMDEGISAFLNA